MAAVVAVTYTSGCFVQMSRGQLCFIILFLIPLKCSIYLTSNELALPFLFAFLRGGGWADSAIARTKKEVQDQKDNTH